MTRPDQTLLLARLLGPAGPELTCEQCFEQLDRSVELELAGAPADEQVPGMRAHLDGCPACDEDHASLLAFVTATMPGDMQSPFTLLNLMDLHDAAPGNGFGHRWEARVAREALDAEATGVVHFRLHAGKRSPFTHRHAEAEETYVILSGRGRVKLDEEILDVGPLDAIRVAPRTARAFEAGPDGLEFIAFGPHHPSDAEPVDDPWTE